MLQLVKSAGATPAPATVPADWATVRDLLLSSGVPEAQLEIAETPGGVWESCGATPGFKITMTLPALITWISAAGYEHQHNSHIGAIKRLLEDAGYDLATRGEPRRAYLAVYACSDTADRAA